MVFDYLGEVFDYLGPVFNYLGEVFDYPGMVFNYLAPVFDYLGHLFDSPRPVLGHLAGGRARAADRRSPFAVRQPAARRACCSLRGRVVGLALGEEPAAMTLEEAIVSALEFEKKVRDHYAFAVQNGKDPAGKKFFALLSREEQGHVDYLEERLKEFRSSGKVSGAPLPTVIPKSDWTIEGVEKLAASAAKRDYSGDVERLFTALKLEDEATDHYKKLVSSLGPEGKTLFRRFLEIEEGHTALVQAEIDVATRTGYFYDFQEFNQED